MKLMINSFLSHVINYYEENKTQYKKSKLNYHDLPILMQNKVITDYIENNFTNEFNNSNMSKLNRIGGLDLGINNIASLALTHGKNQIYSGKSINNKLIYLNSKLDIIKSGIFETNLSKSLYDKVKYNHSINQQNKEIRLRNKSIIDEEEQLCYLDKIKLEVNELQEIKLANNLVYGNLNYNKTLVTMGNYKNNVLHQLSEDIIKRCVRNNIQCLIVGHNEGWKEQVELGKLNNRLFLSIPHNELINMLRYKGESKGIVVRETEESYTSQSSFINNDNLPIHKINKQKENKLSNKELINDMKVDTENNHSHLNIVENIKNSNQRKYRFSGKRSQLNRHDYHINSTSRKKKAKIHADLNGAFNIIRKICVQFNYHGLISLDYELRGIKNNINNNSNKGKRISVMFSLLQKTNKVYKLNNSLLVKD